MEQVLHSPYWHRVAQLRPRLRSQVQVRRRRTRDHDWYLVTNGSSARHHRLNAQAYQLVGRCDGQRRLQQIWDEWCVHAGDAAPTQDEFIRLLLGMQEADLIKCQFPADVRGLLRAKEGKPDRRRTVRVNPLSFQVPLGNPERILHNFDAALPYLFGPLAFAATLLLIASGLVLTTLFWPDLIAYGQARILSPQLLAMAWCCYPVMKLMHELGHALAIRHWGGRVREAGITLFMLVPAPYVDGASASAFPLRRQRVLVSAMGILVETSLASLALVVWTLLHDGALKDLAFVILTMGGGSSLLINGNPLLRFDGYHLFCDLLQLPNLAMRSRRYWVLMCLRAMGRSPSQDELQPTTGERKWLCLYAPLASAFRLWLGWNTVLWLDEISAPAGLGLALVVIYLLFLRPFWNFVCEVLLRAKAGQVRDHRPWAWTVALAGSVLCVSVPVSSYTIAPGVVWLPEQCTVRVPTPGFVTRLTRRDGEELQSGDTIAELDDPALHAQRVAVMQRVEGLQAREFEALREDPSRQRQLQEQLRQARAELDRLDERLRGLQIRAAVGGRLVLPRPADLEGLYLHEGDVLGQVLPDRPATVRVAVNAADAGPVRDQSRAVSVWLPETAAVQRAEVLQAVPAATHLLPSPALADVNGGELATDPKSADGQLASLEPFFLFDLLLPDYQVRRAGSRVWVKFQHDPSPLLARWYRRGRQVLIKHLNPAT